MRARAARLLALPLVLASAACGSSGDEVLDPTEIDFAASLEIDLDAMTRTSSGLYYENVVVGSGAAAGQADGVRVLYRGWLPDGTLFDSAQDPNDPLIFTVGVSNIIAGFDEGVRGMQVGGVRKLVIPPALGYGPNRNGPIPPNSTLVFEVELIGID